jgi:hypothetical protein
MKITKLFINRRSLIGGYENNRWEGSMEAELNAKEGNLATAKEKLLEIDSEIEKIQEVIEAKERAKRVAREFKDIKFGSIYHKDLSAHVRASSVESFGFIDRDRIKLSDGELAQYASRGNIIHKLCNIFLQGGSVKEWKNPKDVPKLITDLKLLKNGSLELDYNACSHIKFFDKYQDDIDFNSETFLIEHIVRDDKSMTCGEIDLIFPFQGKLSVIDIKTGQYKHCWPRMAFYFKHCGLPVEQIVVFPVKPTDNKQGYCKADILDNKKKIDEYYEAFMVQREKLRETFNV